MDTGKLVLALILLILGAAAGYFYGFDVGFERGVNSEERESPVVDKVDEENSPTTPKIPTESNPEEEDLRGPVLQEQAE